MYNNINITAICGKKQNGRFIVNNGVIIFSALILYLLFVTAAPIAAAFFKNSYSLSEINNNPYAKEITKNNSYNNIAITNVTINTATYINNGQMLARQIDNNNLQNYISDTKGSVLKLNSVNKLQNQTYSYDAYGKPITDATKSNSVLNVINSFQYNGERFDNNTALQYLRTRFYNVDTKRFINQDSYELLNRFNYTDGNPVMGADPSGHVNLDGLSRLCEGRFGCEWKFTASISQEQIAKLSVFRAESMEGQNQQIAFARTKLTGKQIIELYKKEGRRDFSGVDYILPPNGCEVSLHGAKLRRAIFSEANFKSAYLGWANFREAIFSEANLSQADCTMTKFGGANLSRANLSGAKLSLANLSGANFFRADLRGANLKGTNLKGTNFTGTIVGYNTIIDTQMPFQSQQEYDLWNRIERIHKINALVFTASTNCLPGIPCIECDLLSAIISFI